MGRMAKNRKRCKIKNKYRSGGLGVDNFKNRYNRSTAPAAWPPHVPGRSLKEFIDLISD